MSLKVWLPLDGDLRNLGTSDIEVTNNGATVDNAGKIGKCYYFDGNAHYLQLSQSVGNLYSGDFSWAVWLKPTDSTRSIISSEYASTGASNVAFELSASRGVRIYWNGSPDIYPSNSTLPIDTWTHVAITKTTGIIKTYINGILTHTYTGTLINRSSTSYIRIGDDYRGGTSVSYMGYMNDWRLYDHCLSAAEVHEIAMGLVLHYKLDGNKMGNPNLLTRYVVPGQQSPTATGTAGRTTWLGDYKIIINAEENADTYFRLFMSQQLVSGSIYTISCKVSGLLEGTYYNFPMFAQNNSSMGYLSLDHNGLCSLTFTMNWTGTQTSVTGANGETVYINFLDDIARNLATGQGPITVYDFKLEEGNSATSWCPNIYDPLYYALGLDKAIIYDSSGYGRNGTINGTLTFSNNSPRYNNASIFTGSNKVQGTFIFPQNTFISEYTWAGWVKRQYETAQAKTIHTNIASIALYTDFSPYMSFTSGKSDGTTTGNGVAGGTSILPLNEWAHMAITYKDGYICLYVNGERTKGVDYSSYGTFIVARNFNILENSFIGQLSDVRIYTTQLLDTDIKMLYNVGMKVDNLGEIHTFELNEQVDNQILDSNLNKDGYVTSFIYDEATNTHTITIPSVDSMYGFGITLGTTHKLYIPWNSSYRLTMEVFSNTAETFVIDYNNYADDMTDMSGNDNDDINNRLASTVAIPANTWTRVTFGTTNNNATKNPHQLSLYDFSHFGMRNQNTNTSLTYQIRNVQWYLVDNTHNIEKNGILNGNHFNETSLVTKASIRNKEKSIEATEFIEI